MTRKEWRRDVQKALIDKNKRMSQMARDLGVTPAWVYQILCGAYEGNAATEWEKQISDYCGIELKGEFDNEEEI